MAQGYAHVQEVLAPDTSALVCATDTLAIGASKYLQQQLNLQLASVGATPLIQFLHPEILSVDPGYGEAGTRAAAQLIAQITRDHPVEQLMIPARITPQVTR